MITLKLPRLGAKCALFGGLIYGIGPLASGSVLTIPINATVGVDSSFDLAGPGVPDLGFWSRESKFFAATIYSNGPSAGYELSSSVNTNANITSANAVNVLMPGDTVGPRDLFFFGTGSAFELNGYDGSGNFPWVKHHTWDLSTRRTESCSTVSLNSH